MGVNYSVRSLYNFINNTYLLELLGNIIVYKKYKNNLWRKISVLRVMKQLSKKSLTEHRGFTKAENKQDIFLK